MRPRSVRVLFAALILFPLSLSAQSQSRGFREVRFDLLSYSKGEAGNYGLGIGVPSSVALGFYLSDRIAIEPSLSFNLQYFEGSGESSSESVSTYSAAVYVPVYLSRSAQGRSGFFVAPGVGAASRGEDDALLLGINAGLKMSRNEKISSVIMVNLRSEEAAYSQTFIGASFGLSYFFK